MEDLRLECFYEQAHTWAKENVIDVRSVHVPTPDKERITLECVVSFPDCDLYPFDYRLVILGNIDAGQYESLSQAVAAAYLLHLSGYSPLDFPVSIEVLGELMRICNAPKCKDALIAQLNTIKWQLPKHL